MEQEPFALGQDVQVVDPDVRGHVYSLVTAVCDTPHNPEDWARLLTRLLLSSEGSMAKTRIATCWEMTPWRVCATSSGG